MEKMVWEPVKNKKELASLLVWVMVNDRPVEGWTHNIIKLRDFANTQARRFGYNDWVQAYHNLKEVKEVE